MRKLPGYLHPSKMQPSDAYHGTSAGDWLGAWVFVYDYFLIFCMSFMYCLPILELLLYFYPVYFLPFLETSNNPRFAHLMVEKCAYLMGRI